MYRKNMLDAKDDFEVDNVRFISEDSIDKNLNGSSRKRWILSSRYFSTWALSNATGISSEVFEAMQKVEAYEAIGKLVIDLDKVSDLAQILVKYDGYGHHFNNHDGNEEEITFNGVKSLRFR